MGQIKRKKKKTKCFLYVKQYQVTLNFLNHSSDLDWTISSTLRIHRVHHGEDWL